MRFAKEDFTKTVYQMLRDSRPGKFRSPGQAMADIRKRGNDAIKQPKKTRLAKMFK